MKTVFWVLALLVFAMPAWTSGSIRIDLPSAAGLIGLGPKIDITITNMTPFYGGSVVVLDENVGELLPGGSMHDRRSFEFDRTEMPVVVRFYEWSDGGRGDFIGVAAKTLSLHRSQPTSWVVQTSDVKWFDGRQVSYGFGYGQSPYPAPDAASGVREVDFPRIFLKSTTVFQFVNVTLFQARVRINGREMGGMNEPGNIFVFSHWNKYDRSFPVNVEVIFTDRGRLVGHYETTASIGTDPRAIQFVLTPDKIRRY